MPANNPRPALPYALDGSPITAPQDLQLGQARFTRIDDGTAQMNVNGLPAGALEVIWNGTGAGDTGGDWTPSGDGSESASAAHSGTNGWDSGPVGANSETDFDNGSLLDVGGSYNTLSFWLQPKAYPNNATLQVQWKNNLGTVIGATLNVEDYVPNMDLDVWQRVQIPISDFNLTANVQVLRVVYKTGNQQHWIDDIELQSAGGGGPFTFRVAAPDAQTRYHLTMLVVLFAAGDTGWTSSAFVNVAGGLTNGFLCRQRRLSDGEVLWSINSRDNTDLFGRYHPQESFAFADNNLLVGFMVKPGKRASVVITDDEVLEFIVQDDLTSLSQARAFAHFGIERVAP